MIRGPYDKPCDECRKIKKKCIKTDTGECIYCLNKKTSCKRNGVSNVNEAPSNFIENFLFGSHFTEPSTSSGSFFSAVEPNTMDSSLSSSLRTDQHEDLETASNTIDLTMYQPVVPSMKPNTMDSSLSSSLRTDQHPELATASNTIDQTMYQPVVPSMEPNTMDSSLSSSLITDQHEDLATASNTIDLTMYQPVVPSMEPNTMDSSLSSSLRTDQHVDLGTEPNIIDRTTHQPAGLSMEPNTMSDSSSSSLITEPNTMEPNVSYFLLPLPARRTINGIEYNSWFIYSINGADFIIIINDSTY
nr:6570_t:CDS:2 [Entrophospora candida]